MIAVRVAPKKLIAGLMKYRDRRAKLCPTRRTIKLDDAWGRKYSSPLHPYLRVTAPYTPRNGAPPPSWSSLTDSPRRERPYSKHIRDKTVITLITPCRSRRRRRDLAWSTSIAGYRENPGKQWRPLIYWGNYVGAR